MTIPDSVFSVCTWLEINILMFVKRNIKDGELQYTGSLDDFRTHYKDVGATLEDIIVKVERRPLDESAII